MAKKMKLSSVTTEDDGINLDDMHESQAAAGPARLRGHRVLLLNADYSPLSYKPLSTIPWTKAFFWLAKGWNRMEEGKPPIINVVEESEEVVHAGDRVFKVPAVVALTSMAPMPQKAPFTRANIFLRDDYTCQYTGVRLDPSDLNIDHVIPISRKGKNSWENVVACEKGLNFGKADRTPKEAGLRLIKQPHVPSAWELREKGRSYPSKFDHDSWADYVFWNTILEEDH